jgi:hypothetical protein
MPAKHLKVAVLDVQIAEQEEWILEHGSDEAGYVKRYGSKYNENHFGNGGEAIYAADLAHLNALKARRKP